jgi:2-dehydropantoate 2-reductase
VSTRFVVYGAGAVGGAVGARLHQSGQEVALLARGAHLDAIRRDGLTLLSPAERVTLPIPAADDPAELDTGRPGDIVLLAVKSQDTADALSALRRAGADRVPIVCLQNGVDNERMALRAFPDVYGAVVMAPTAHLERGVIEVYGTEASGMVDVGRCPEGIDARCEEIVSALTASRFHSRASANVMRLKYAKLVLNLANAVGALVADSDERRDELIERVRAEGRAALDAAGISYEDPEVDDLEGRWSRIGVEPIAGRERAGSSSWQSLARRTGSLETDYLNGEIVLLGALHRVPTPVNAALCRLAERHARLRRGPGELSVDDVVTVAA